MSSDKDNKDIDELSGIETTGHEWDGLKELNNPLPRWWVWVWVISIIWALWYFVIYPAWPVPGGATEGTQGYTQYKELEASQSEIHARQAEYLHRFEEASFSEILNDPALYGFAKAGGWAAFKDNCATCHGTGAEGGNGYPNLNDDDWLWGGKIDDIYLTLQHGIRVAGDYDTRQSQMPAFGKEGTLTRKQINEVIHHIEAMGEDHVNHNSEGYRLFQQNCASCHGPDGKGMREFGAPNLTDAIWLYGGSHDALYETIYNARAGMMPAWKERLDDNTIRQLAVYVHELGGGEGTATMAPPAAAPAYEAPVEAPTEIKDINYDPNEVLEEQEDEH